MFACPNCGGNLKFHIPSQQLACEYCQSQFDPYSFDHKEKDAQEMKEFEVTVFSCPQCGGEILSTDTTAAGFCSFCGASTILYSRISHELRPEYIIPFQQTKEDCKKSYAARMKKAIFAPKELRDEKCIDGFRGIYMPYWAFYMTQDQHVSMEGKKSHRRGDYIITDHYDLDCDLHAYYKGLSYDASSSFSDDISQAIAPYDVKGMKAFTPAYLSGFYADTADIEPRFYETDARNEAFETSRRQLTGHGAFAGYSPTIKRSADPSYDSLGTTTQEIDRTMFPVWFLSYRKGDRVAYATVNGQTGKVVNDLPVDPKRYLFGSLLLAIPLFILFNLLFTMKPTSLVTITTAISVISLILFAIESGKLKRKENGLDDKGLLASKKVQRTQVQAEKGGSAGYISSIIAIVISGLILVTQPVSDIFYYGAAILSLIAVGVCISRILRSHNLLATRRLPQFDYQGGDDRA